MYLCAAPWSNHDRCISLGILVGAAAECVYYTRTGLSCTRQPQTYVLGRPRLGCKVERGHEHFPAAIVTISSEFFQHENTTNQRTVNVAATDKHYHSKSLHYRASVELLTHAVANDNGRFCLPRFKWRKSEQRYSNELSQLEYEYIAQSFRHSQVKSCTRNSHYTPAEWQLLTCLLAPPNSTKLGLSERRGRQKASE